MCWVVCDRSRAILSHAWLVTPWLETSLLLPKPQLLLLPAATPPPVKEGSSWPPSFLSDLDVGLELAASSGPGSIGWAQSEDVGLDKHLSTG